MKFVVRTDTGGWELKHRRVRRSMAEAAVAAVAVVARALFKRSQRNLKGAHYPPPDYKGPGTGEMPVPRVTATLARSLKIKKINPVRYMVYADSGVAGYAAYVHDGTRYMKPRRFIGDAVRVNGEAWRKFIAGRIRRAIDRAQE